MGDKIILQEVADRKARWNELLERGGPKEISPAILRALGIYGGAQGIWVDKARTSTLTDDGYGIAVSLTHSGKSYPDDWSTDGVIYHYPDTNRPQGRDTSEIEATKNAQKFGVPVFVITHTSHSKGDVLTVNRNRTVWLCICADFSLLRLRELLMGSLMCTVALDGHHIQNDTMVDHAVDRSHGGHGIFENALPLTEHEIGTDQHRFAFIALRTSLFIMRLSLPQSSN